MTSLTFFIISEPLFPYLNTLLFYPFILSHPFPLDFSFRGSYLEKERNIKYSIILKYLNQRHLFPYYFTIINPSISINMTKRDLNILERRFSIFTEFFEITII